MADPFKPTHAPSPGMDLKMKGPGADAVNREAFQARQAQAKSHGDAHVAQAKSAGRSSGASFSKEASQAYKQASTGDRNQAGAKVLSKQFNGQGR